MKPITTKLAGVTYGDAQANIKEYGGPGIGHYELIREPDNPHDPNAIRVALFGQIFMGYLPAKVSATIAPLMDQGRCLVAEFVRLNIAAGKRIVGMTVRIEERNPLKAQQVG